MLSLLQTIGLNALFVPKLMKRSWSGDAGAAAKVLISWCIILIVCIHFGIYGLKMSIICAGVYWMIRKTATARAFENLVVFLIHLLTTF